MRRYASVATVFLIAGRYRKYRRYRRKPTHGGAVKRRVAVHRPQDGKPPAGRKGTFDRA
ncbi:hypothetical protein [Merdimonas faecis]|uniref:hypothetical protein n=1 Tax=Merdimonas faecis TaxID=1653435 RepID=UPI0015592752|nr:hypothetical protein [Merdimonas faecis]